jgi:hypothetical protein
VGEIALDLFPNEIVKDLALFTADGNALDEVMD